MARYWCYARPPESCTVPAGFTTYKAFWPPERDGNGAILFGYVEYPEALPTEEVARWELTPDDPVERARLQIWRHGAEWILGEPVECIREVAADPHHPYALVAQAARRRLQV